MHTVASQAQKSIDFSFENEQPVILSLFDGPRAIEGSEFPFEQLSDIAEIESWRKEINRPIYHIHKWWAQRLGSVFRAIVLGIFAPNDADIIDLFYKPSRIYDATIFDPFMGSGTTIGESLKLGARAIGRDINPVAHFLVKNALSIHDREAILKTFSKIERDVAPQIRQFYKTFLSDGRKADVLYYFWVKVVDCPNCAESVDLFSSYIFAKHAYRKKYPESHSVCPYCGDINQVLYNDSHANCGDCGKSYNPQTGPAKGTNAICLACDNKFQIAKAFRNKNQAPRHRLYAKLALMPDGEKIYFPATHEDKALFDQARDKLKTRLNAYPVVSINPGYNTNQVLNYNYRNWHDMFTSRQLLCLSILSERIRQIKEPLLKDLFTCLFSGTLEFNNLFTSYKGEGTGAVRHMFSHHILKPECTPLEANIWGTKKSSGSFMTMFEGRIRRALDYADNPFELHLKRAGGKKVSKKIYGLSEKLGFNIASNFKAFENGKSVYLSCGDSSCTDIADASVDAIISDPPFFDNVHYSQLADFFHVWQRHILNDRGSNKKDTTRSEAEVQNTDVNIFTDRLQAVWKEAHRVLKDSGILVFTYHHSKSEGWSSILHALLETEFAITAAQPIKAEMSVAIPKSQTKEPIDIDVIIVCRKRSQTAFQSSNGNFWPAVLKIANEQVRRFYIAGRHLSRNDIRVIIMAQLLRQISVSESIKSTATILDENNPEVEAQIERLYGLGTSVFHDFRGEA